MKISLNTNIPNANNRSFSGLWGRTSKNIDFDSALNLPKTRLTTYYYPYDDESPEDVKKLVEDKTHAQFEIPEGSRATRYVIEECKLGYTLPFTKDEYFQYKKMKEIDKPTPLFREITHHVKEKFLIEKYEQQEKYTALNTNIDYKKLDYAC